MNKPELYVHVNQLQRCGTQEALQEFAGAINWRFDGRDSVLDAGCGPGDVTVDILMPILPSSFQRLVGVDISTEMIDYARKTQIHPKLSFEQFDLSKDLEKQSLSSTEPFDHIFSFCTLMWVANVATCFRNFYKLLVPNGDMLLLFPNHPVFDVYKEQSRNTKWSKYMMDVDNFLPPFQYSPNLTIEVCNRLSGFGFTDCDVKVHDKNVTAENFTSIRGMAKF